MHIPSQYLPIMPYLILNDAARFLDFAKAVFGATEQMLVRGDDQRSIMHSELRVFDGIVMFASSGDLWQEKTSGMFIYVDSVDKVYDLAMRNNARSLQLPNKQEYGYAAGFEDPFGNQWWITEPQSTQL